MVAGNPYTFSADYVQYFYEELETLSVKGCVAFFLTGAAADQRIGEPIDTKGMTFDNRNILTDKVFKEVVRLKSEWEKNK